MELTKQISKYVTENLLYVDDGFEYDNDTSFIGEGLIDSMGVMELLTYVQSTFDITVDQQEVTPDNFDSVNKLADFVRRKQQTAAVLAQSGD
jgi:acyl carrier protein